MKIAFDAAEALGVPRLLDEDDYTDIPPERLSTITYLSEIWKRFRSWLAVDMKKIPSTWLSFLLNVRDGRNFHKEVFRKDSIEVAHKCDDFREGGHPMPFETYSCTKV